ncbi:MAG: ROK family glucokinase [Lachnospiraceae bacterium]|nr:ROK family glucokinase [Lachnospiraceae bacterium]
MSFVYGVDVGGTSVKIGLFSGEGELIEKWSVPTRTENNGEAILPDIAASIDAKSKEKGIADGEILGVGLGLPGPVDDKGVIRKAVNLHWHDTFNVEEKLAACFDGRLKVKAGNDANVAALGEAWMGAGKGYKNIVMVTLGTGIGGGVIINGQIVTGTWGAAGEIGHIYTGADTKEPCNCGNRGCLEQFASATGIVRLLKEELENNPDEPTEMRDRPLDSKNMWEAVKNGDRLSIRVAEKFGKYLGTGLSVVAGVLNPEIIIIGGGVSMSGDVIMPYITKNFKEHVFHASGDTIFTRATLGNDGGIYGAAALLI